MGGAVIGSRRPTVLVHHNDGLQSFGRAILLKNGKYVTCDFWQAPTIPLLSQQPPERYLCQSPCSAPLLFATQMCNLVGCAEAVGGVDALLEAITCSIGHSQGCTAALVVGAAEGVNTYNMLTR